MKTKFSEHTDGQIRWLSRLVRCILFPIVALLWMTIACALAPIVIPIGIILNEGRDDKCDIIAEWFITTWRSIPI